MVWMHYSTGRFLMCGENTREWYGRMLYFVDYFFGFFKKGAKKWQLCQFSVFYQRKFNGIKRFCGANQKKNMAGFTTLMLLWTQIWLPYCLSLWKAKGQTWKSASTMPLLSTRWITKLSVVCGITLDLSAPLHVALEHESIFCSRGEQKQSVGDHSFNVSGSMLMLAATKIIKPLWYMWTHILKCLLCYTRFF